MPIVPVVTATPAPPGTFPTNPLLQALSIPTDNALERQNASATRLYLTAFQSYDVSVIDALSGHTLHEIPVEGDQAGMVVSPDGARLYVVDGSSEGQLRVFDTRTWSVIHREPIHDRALVLGGNPISLSGDGQWLLVEHYSYARSQEWKTIFDTLKLGFLPVDAWKMNDCRQDVLPPQLIGRVGHARLYIQCHDYLAAQDASSLTVLWRAAMSNSYRASLALLPDGARLFSITPTGSNGCGGGSSDLDLRVWDTQSGNEIRRVKLSDQMVVPTATCGRGGGVYLIVSTDGAQIFVAWENRVWRLSANDLKVNGELKMPAPIDGMALSMDDRELYVLPATSGDLTAREHGMWTIETEPLKIVRRASDWPPLTVPFFFSALAPK